MLKRIVLSLVAVLLYGWTNFLLNPIATIMSGNLAGKQFENSNTAYVQSVVGMRFFGHFGVPAFLLLVVLAAIWWKYLRGAWKAIAGAALVLALGFISAPPTQAYYDKSDWAEVVIILPNQSAFWVPDVGDNKTSQKKFMSKEYLAEQKIAAKRFQISHTKLGNSGSFRDYYVPTGRLIIVDRTPQAREWVSSADRGTSTKNEGFPCQSKEGINMSLGISVGVSVLEDDSPSYLYRFGVYQDPNEDRSKPEVQFKSVYYARGLSEVTDAVVRRKVLSTGCGEVAKRSFDEANKQMPEMMAAIQTEMAKYLASVGITLDFIGWADTINFDHEIQKAVNQAYIAAKLTPYMDTLERMARIETMQKWHGDLPLAMTGSLREMIDRIFPAGKK